MLTMTYAKQTAFNSAWPIMLVARTSSPAPERAIVLELGQMIGRPIAEMTTASPLAMTRPPNTSILNMTEA